MAYDFNAAGEQRSFNELIPDGTVCPVHLTIRPGNAGEGGWLKRAADGGSMALDCEFTVVEGPYAKRKFWTLMTVEGSTEGHAKAGEITMSRLRAILESARGIKPSDESEAARIARRVNSYGDFDGLRFLARVSVEKGGTQYKDKNALDIAITPDRKEWTRVEQVAKTAGATPGQHQAAAAVQKPEWAK
ncbi:hypothetical protein [Bradyrhizobium elkanii]|uniref:hypothetical protein n=1 Tax=Bradyrhizobium elkanii TaxID=29448 RepID=UPI0004030360|nr:hypothetical protein [Bradyrhizobium elkanii]